MRKSLITFALIGLLAVPALAAQTFTYDWDGEADYLGCFSFATTAEVGVAFNRDGSAGNGLLLTKTVTGGNAVSFLAAVWHLQEGDEVTVSVWRYDNLPSMPYFGLWAHYNDALNGENARSQSLQLNDGTVTGDNRLGTQNGWEEYSHTWTIGAGHTGLVIDAVISDTNSGGQILIDDLTITVPDHASVRLPDAIYANGVVTPNTPTSWTSVKNLFN
jgi:hypothetical protein